MIYDDEHRLAWLYAEVEARAEAGRDPLADLSRYSRKAVEAWRGLGDFDGAVMRALGLDAIALDDENHDDRPLAEVLCNRGARFACVVQEPSFRVETDKALRDANLDRPTMHLATQWRFPRSAEGPFPAEEGRSAIIIPVSCMCAVWRDAWNGGIHCEEATMLSLAAVDYDPSAFELDIADLIAIPLDGGKSLSFTGYTTAIGSLGDADDGALKIFANGKAWIEAHLARIRAICADTPAHLAIELHGTELGALPAGVLLLEPRAFEWRVCRRDCVVPLGASKILCPDSPNLAKWLAAEMRKPDVVRAMPEVFGPGSQKRAAA